jgi:MSHA pilin protein MshD
MKPGARQLGATLIEMVVSILIISVTLTSVMMVITQIGRSSADPMIRTQATAIAQAYMDEILAQALDDPDGAESGGAEPGEMRANFDDVSDYHGLADSDGARDQIDAAVAGLGGYNVEVTVSAATIGGYPAKRIQVQVGFDGDPNLLVPIVAYRMN